MEACLEIKEKKNGICPVYVQNDLNGLNELIHEKHPLANQILVLSDETVLSFHKETIRKQLNEYNVLFYSIVPGEASKSLENAVKVIEFMTNNGFHRNDLMIALGGGVVGDLAGLIAGLYMRGISFIQMPTSLLAMVDSSIGGKCGVNDQKLKNNVGLFNLPSFVFINTAFLDTLSGRQYFAGFSEIMKIALACDKTFYIELLDHMYEILDMDMSYVPEMITKAISLKKALVDKDFYDTKHERAILNLGHTFAHAFEMVFPSEFLHGEAVALGCVAAAYVSWKSDLIKMEDYYEIRDMFVPFHQPISLETDDQHISMILEKMRMDKKNESGKISLVLLKTVGKAYLEKNVDESLILEALNEINFTEN